MKIVSNSGLNGMKLSAKSLCRLRAALDKKPKTAEMSLFDDNFTTELQSEMQDELDASEAETNRKLEEERKKWLYNEKIELLAEKLSEPEVLSGTFGRENHNPLENESGRVVGSEANVTLKIIAQVKQVVLPTPEEEAKYGEFQNIKTLLETIMLGHLVDGDWAPNSDVASSINDALKHHFDDAESTEINKEQCVVSLMSNTPNNDETFFDDGTIDVPGTADLVFTIDVEIEATFVRRKRY
jgi:hypothetical protein